LVLTDIWFVYTRVEAATDPLERITVWLPTTGYHDLQNDIRFSKALAEESFNPIHLDSKVLA
jgi:hypothetical protein